MAASGLHHHHHAEDAKLWDTLEDRAPGCALHVGLMRAQHARIAGILEETERLARWWVVDADPAVRDRLAERADALSAALEAHLKDEEGKVLPVVQQVLTQLEWEEVGEAARSESDPALDLHHAGAAVHLRHREPAGVRSCRTSRASRPCSTTCSGTSSTRGRWPTSASTCARCGSPRGADVSEHTPQRKLERMSGHSKWATTKHKKAIIDSRRAKSFAKLIKNIEVAAKMGGADLAGNPTLQDAVQKAKKTSVPIDNINRAVKRGAGLTGESVDYATIMYEGYGPTASRC